MKLNPSYPSSLPGHLTPVIECEHCGLIEPDVGQPDPVWWEKFGLPARHCPRCHKNSAGVYSDAD